MYNSVGDRAVWFFVWSIGSVISGVLLLVYLPLETKGLALREKLKKSFGLSNEMQLGSFNTLCIKLRRHRLQKKTFVSNCIQGETRRSRWENVKNNIGNLAPQTRNL